ncbi:hypothetical protein E2C01_058566 [Portunus trituberculatus]|uniref:Uncharacterized protein n=1 Tax=Portunus trituberculatus TaxID=210409 RepID=A0A5B7GWU0_PORTR|nr:hypothetical protein [Portunus trituberculatus]
MDEGAGHLRFPPSLPYCSINLAQKVDTEGHSTFSTGEALIRARNGRPNAYWSQPGGYRFKKVLEKDRQRDSQEEPPRWRKQRNNAQVEWVLLIRVGVAASNTANEHSSRPPHLPRHETTTGARVVLNHNNLPYLMRN